MASDGSRLPSLYGVGDKDCSCNDICRCLASTIWMMPPKKRRANSASLPVSPTYCNASVTNQQTSKLEVWPTQKNSGGSEWMSEKVFENKPPIDLDSLTYYPAENILPDDRHSMHPEGWSDVEEFADSDDEFLPASRNTQKHLTSRVEKIRKPHKKRRTSST